MRITEYDDDIFSKFIKHSYYSILCWYIVTASSIDATDSALRYGNQLSRYGLFASNAQHPHGLFAIEVRTNDFRDAFLPRRLHSGRFAKESNRRSPFGRSDKTRRSLMRTNSINKAIVCDAFFRHEHTLRLNALKSALVFSRVLS